MFYILGRMLQVMGLIVPLLAVSGNLARPEWINVKAELTLAALGMGIFFIGWLIQGKAPPKR